LTKALWDQSPEIIVLIKYNSMKILIVFIPRTKSTMTHEILVNKFHLQPLGEPLTISRRKNQHYNEYPDLIDHINKTDNICIKICINDFIDLKSCMVNDAYKTIDYNSFNHIIFINRTNILDTVLSYGYMNPAVADKWHRPRGKIIIPKKFTIDSTRMYYILRAYRLYKNIKTHIVSNAILPKIYHYEYDTIEITLKTDFNLSDSDLVTSTEANGIDYSLWADNYQEILSQFDQTKQKILSATDEDIADRKSFFWQNQVGYI